MPATTILLLAAALPYFSGILHAQTPLPAADKSNVTSILRRQFEAQNSAGNNLYVIAAADVLDVDVVDVPEFSRNYRVGPDGTIMIPMLALPIRAQGLTLTELSAVISRRLRAAQLVSDPHVMVSVESSQWHAVAISGAVRSPQIYPIFAPTTLLDVISRAGGLAPDAGGTAIVTRGDIAAASAGPARHSGAAPPAGSIQVDLQKLIATGDPQLNITVYPGDKVTVRRAGVVYVVGAVRRPGGFALGNGRDKMTVLQAVAMGEGLSATAMLKRAMIIRRGEQFSNGREEIPVNLSKILSGRAPDPGLEANDILFIPDSASKRALQRGAETALQIATGVVIWGRY